MTLHLPCITFLGYLKDIENYFTDHLKHHVPLHRPALQWRENCSIQVHWLVRLLSCTCPQSVTNRFTPTPISLPYKEWGISSSSTVLQSASLLQKQVSTFKADGKKNMWRLKMVNIKENIFHLMHFCDFSNQSFSQKRDANDSAGQSTLRIILNITLNIYIWF